MTDVLGVDIGGVLMDGVREDPEWLHDPPEVGGAFGAMARLHRERFPARCWLVSRCEVEAESDLMNWLAGHGFFGATGIDPKRVLFCRETYEKAEICRGLGVTHFIDDRLAVLNRMIGVVPNLYCLVSRASDVEVAKRGVNCIKTVHTWIEITNALLNASSRA